jgi:hypothetical protein
MPDAWMAGQRFKDSVERQTNDFSVKVFAAECGFKHTCHFILLSKRINRATLSEFLAQRHGKCSG